MIAIAGIEDQEFAIGTEGSGEFDMRVGGCDDLRASPGRNEYPFGFAAKSVIDAIFADDLAL